MSNTNKVMNINQVCKTLWRGMPIHQLLTNKIWLKAVHSKLKEGGVWVYPARGLVFIKSGDGFIQQ